LLYFYLLKRKGYLLYAENGNENGKKKIFEKNKEGERCNKEGELILRG